MHNFMPMHTSMLHGNQEREEARDSCFMNQLKQNIQTFWRERLTEICEASDARDRHSLPLARVKKVMKSDENVKMISANTPVMFAKACEIFVMELTLRAWMHTQENKRRTLQRNDVAVAIRDEDLLGFLKDMVPMEIYHQEAQLSEANHQGVYVPLPVRGTPMMPPNLPANMQNMNLTEVKTGVRPVATDHDHVAFSMNLQQITTPSFFARYQEVQEDRTFPPTSAPANEDNPYLGFRNFFQ